MTIKNKFLNAVEILLRIPNGNLSEPTKTSGNKTGFGTVKIGLQNSFFRVIRFP
jgi:hypothetical protein